MLSSAIIAARLIVEDINDRLHAIARRLVRKLVEIVVTDLDLTAAFSQVGEAAQFERAHLLGARPLRSREQLYAYALGNRPNDERDGLLLEFGVYKGDSINRLARLTPGRHWYGFDSFEGLPEIWTPGARKGAFDLNGELPKVRHNVDLIKGFFIDTLPAFVERHRDERISVLHIDCDLYSATKQVLFALGPMLQPGCIVIFDEYFNYPDWRDGEYKAFAEYTAASVRAFEYVCYVRHRSQVAVRLL